MTILLPWPTTPRPDDDSKRKIRLGAQSTKSSGPPTRAADIQELEDLRHDGAGPEELSDKAIEICKRLQNDIRAARHGHYGNSVDLELERQDFEAVLEGIWQGRSDGVLDEFIRHTQTHGGPLDG